MPMNDADPHPDGNDKTLELVYDYLVSERNRLRDARREVTSRLGPLPAAAALVFGLFAGLPDHIQKRGFVWAALVVFLGLGALSAWGIRLKSYRGLTPANDPVKCRDQDRLGRTQWLVAQIARERDVYERLGNYFDKERKALLGVQVLVALQVVLLVLARLLP
jgi:hypothetical protein